ncbi:adhesion G protein-coupled receptor L4-like isoform X2 [Physella acuta]|uniref:adhesion G protein-coupled receptor L4-like isoform X2 n=1 Tax=Physella acuta TaxID=109671 RepID=UPI0027DD71DB|nr:adhesion G protein-coupled receptor L4-like isoform X2 [Physella acuta]
MHVFWSVIVCSCVTFAYTQDSSECPENYVKIHRSCYKFVTDGDSTAEWAESPDGCDGNNPVLVQTVAEMNKLEEYMNKNKFAAGKYWVGIRKDTAKGDKPKWLDNSDVAQPITKPNRRRYDCSALNLQPNQFQLVLHDCDDTLPYICEYTQFTARPQTATTTPDMQIADSSVLSTGTIRLDPSIPKSATPGNVNNTSATQGTTKPSVYVPPPTENIPTVNTRKVPEVSHKEKVPGVSSHVTNTTTTPTTTPTSTPTTTPTTTPTGPTKRTTTTPASTTTTSSVETKLKAYKNCYIPSFGSNLMEQLITAETFYTNPRVCPNTTIGSVNWPSTLPGQTAQVRCKNRKGTATWACSQQETKICWIGQPDVSGCVDEKLQKILNLVRLIETQATNESKPTEPPPSGKEVVEMTSQIKEVTTNKETTMEDVLVMSRVLMLVTKKKDNAPPKDIQQIKDIVDNVIAAGSNLVSTNKSAMWEEMTQVDKVNSALTLLVAMETATLAMADEIKQPIVITKQDENIDLKLHVISEDTFTKENKTELVYTTDQSETSFTIPKETLFSFNKEGELAKVVFMTHYSMADILGVQEKPKTKTDPEVSVEEKSSEKKERMEEKSDIRLHIASYILSASLGADGHAHKLPKPVTFRMKHVTAGYKDPVCAFLNTSIRDHNFWSTKGCYVETREGTLVVCVCDHFTNFAVMMSPIHISEKDFAALSIISSIGCVISIVCVTATIIIYAVVWRFVKRDRSVLHTNLSVSLGIGYIIFLSGINRTENEVVCKIIAVLLHYCFLVVFFTLLAQGFVLLKSATSISTVSILKYLLPMVYVIPLIIVVTSLIVTKSKGYGTDKFCWLSPSDGLHWAFAGPVIFVISVNLIVLVVVLQAIQTSRAMQDKTKTERTKSAARNVLVLSPILGVTWLFGVFSINNDLIVFQYLFAIFNSIQGVLIFVFHCLLQHQVREGLSVLRHRYKSKSLMSTSKSTGSSSNPKKNGLSEASGMSSIITDKEGAGGKLVTIAGQS